MKTCKPKHINSVFFILLALGLLLALIGAFSAKVILIGIGLFLAFAAFVFRCIFYRCPSCGRYIGKIDGDYCTHCKKNINGADR